MDYSALATPVLVLVRGLPGSGKSFVAAALGQAIGASNVVALDPDATDHDSTAYRTHVVAATADGVDPKLHAYRFLRAQAHGGIRAHKVIIWNQPFTNREIFQKMISGLQAYASDQHTNLKVLIVEVNVPTAVALERVERRKQAGGHGPSQATFDRFARDYISFADEGYRTVIVNGEADVETSLNEVLEALATV